MRGRLRDALIALALSGAFALVFFIFNTPLGPSIGSDNAMYLTMGTALARGHAPYTQIFDHKGPLLFLIETLPQLFFGGYQTVTVFILEWLFLFGCLLAIGDLCDRLGVRAAWVLQLCYLALFAPCAGGGNLSEEYANLFTLLGLCLMLRAFGGEKVQKRLFLPATGVGLLATLCFLTRANNALPLLGASAGLCVYLAVKRSFPQLGACALGCLCGCLIALLPTALWLQRRGALGEAIYGAILHNLMYAGAEGGSRMAMLLGSSYGALALLMAGLAALGAMAAFARTRRAAVSLAMLAGAVAALVAAFVSHKFYQHYLTLGAPLAVLGVAQALTLLRERRPAVLRAAIAAIALVCCAGLGVQGRAANAQRLSEREGLEAFSADAQALYAQVPEEGRDFFMAYRVEPRWYVASKALPCMRFYFLQEMLAQVDPRVMDEIVETFESDPPQWLVIFYDRSFDPPYDPRVQEIFETKYAFVDARGEYQLLRLTDTQN